MLVAHSLSRFSRSVRDTVALAKFERDQLRECTTTTISHLRLHNRRISFTIPLGYDLAKDGITLPPQ